LTDTDGSRQSAELQCSKHSEFASSEQTVVEQFCRVSVAPINSNASAPAAPTSPATTMFFKSSENSCCGSVTIKSEQEELGLAVSSTYHDVRLQDAEILQDLWKCEMPFETQFCNSSSFTFNGHNAAAYYPQVSHELDVCSGLFPVYPSYRPDVVPSSTDTASLGTIVSTSELPAPVRCLLTPPDSSPNSPRGDPADEDIKMSPEEIGYPSDSNPDDATSPPENNGFLVLTPVTQRPRRTHPGCTTIKYKRKNTSELDHRRVHFCSFPG